MTNPITEHPHQSVRSIISDISSHRTKKSDEYMGYDERSLHEHEAWKTGVVHVKDLSTELPTIGEAHFNKEAKLFAKGLLAAALSLLGKSKLPDKIKRENALRSYLEDPAHFSHIIGKWKTIDRQEMMSTVCDLIGKSYKEVDDLVKEGHLVRSKEKRKAIYHTWIDPINNKKCFALTQPLGQYTKDQWRFQTKDLATPDDKIQLQHLVHATTSHQRSKWEGTPNFVRITAGILNDDGSVAEIVYDGVGRASLPPYQDFKKKNRETRWEILATTLRNQQEVMSALARIRIEQDFARMTPQEIKALLIERQIAIPSGVDLLQHALANIDKIYDDDHPLEVKEIDMRVISPGQKVKREYQSEQFQLTCQAFDLCNAQSTLAVDIAIGGSEKSFKIKPKSTLFCFGVNGWRRFPHQGQKNQNNRAMNELFFATCKALTDLKREFPPRFSSAHYERVLAYLNRIKRNCKKVLADIEGIEAKKSQLEQEQVNLLRRFSEEKINVEQGGSRAKLDRLIELLGANEKQLAKINAKLYKKQDELSKRIKKLWNRLPRLFDKSLAVFSKNVKNSLIDAEGLSDQQKALQKAYNILHRFKDIQQLYYTGDWKKTKNNFLLQSLVQQHAYDLGAIPGGGCKSFNDRGVVAAMTTITDAFNRKFAECGLYLGVKSYCSEDWKKRGDKIFRGTPPVHHAQNEVIGGGKFKGAHPLPRATNKQWGEIAEWAKMSMSRYSVKAKLRALVHAVFKKFGKKKSRPRAATLLQAASTEAFHDTTTSLSTSLYDKTSSHSLKAEMKHATQSQETKELPTHVETLSAYQSFVIPSPRKHHAEEPFGSLIPEFSLGKDMITESLLATSQPIPAFGQVGDEEEGAQEEHHLLGQS